MRDVGREDVMRGGLQNHGSREVRSCRTRDIMQETSWEERHYRRRNIEGGETSQEERHHGRRHCRRRDRGEERCVMGIDIMLLEENVGGGITM